MTTGEFMRLVEDGREELRRREFEERRGAGASGLRGWGRGGRWLEHERANCGKCKEGGYHHGPYWYLYEHTGGRMKSRYAGRRLFESVAEKVEELANKKPEEVYPEEYDPPVPFVVPSPRYRE